MPHDDSRHEQLQQAPLLEGLTAGRFTCPVQCWAALSTLLMQLLSRAQAAGRIREDSLLRITVPLTTASRLHRAAWQELPAALDADDCRILAQLLAEYLEHHTAGYSDTTVPALTATDEQLGELLRFLQSCGGFAARP